MRDEGQDAYGSPRLESAPEERVLQQSGGLGVHSGPAMKRLSSSVLWGCNVHHGATVIRQEIDLGPVASLHSGQAGPEFAAGFVERFGGLRTLNPDGALTADFLNRLDSAEGVPFVEVLFQAILAVEGSMAYAMRRLGELAFAEIVASPSPERATLVWSCRNPAVSRRAAEVALVGVGELLPEALRAQPGTTGEDFKTAHRALRKLAARGKLDYNSSVVVQAAERRGIPWEPIGRRFIRLGQGKFQHRINYSATENTSFLAQRFSRDKEITNRLLADVGVPVPQQTVPGTIDEALSAAKRIGYPVVVKPVNGHSGKGVCVGLKSAEEVPAAFEHASRFGSGVIVESFIEGQDHRLLVVDGRLIAAMKRVPPLVIGDGRRTIGDLVKDLNREPRRDGRMLKKVAIDEALKHHLEKTGRNLDTVPDQGETVVLRATANVSTGGITVDVTDEVHHDNKVMAIRAAAAIGLDVTGVDLVTTDIGQSYKKVGGAILEVNVRPGIDMHTWPIEGKPRDSAGAVIETMLPPGDQGRVPVAMVVGRRGPGSGVAQALDDILRSAGMTVGLVSRKGPFIDGEPLGPEEATRRKATAFVLRHPQVEALVGTVSPLQVKRQGLVHDRCDVAAILDTESDEDIEEVREGLAVVVRATRGKLVVDAESERALAAVRDVDPARLVLVASSGDSPVLLEHAAAGGLMATKARDSDERVIALMEGDRKVLSIPVAAVPGLAEKRSRRRLRAHLFAVALAHAMGCTGEEITASMKLGRTGFRRAAPLREMAHETG